MRGPAHLPLVAGLSNPLRKFAPVLAMTLIRDVGAGPEVLCAVRRPETNATHPNVLSVPTRRVDLDFAERWPAATDNAAEIPKLPYVVEELFARKLGLADALEYCHLRYDLGRFGAWQGRSYIGYEDGCDIAEDLTMFNVIIQLRDGHGATPGETAAYSWIRWVPIPAFLRALETKDVTQIHSELDGVLVCVYGLCVETTRHLLTEWDLQLARPQERP